MDANEVKMKTNEITLNDTQRVECPANFGTMSQ